MRIAVGQVWQESNTFNPLPTTRVDFEQFSVLRGQEIVERMAHTNELGGFIQSLRSWPEQPEILGLVRLSAWPGGPALYETFCWVQQEITEALRQRLPVDAVLLALHGAMVAEEVPDVEGSVLEAVRSLIGGAVPLVATLDLHANVTRRMVEAADALVFYHTVPHLDVFETGQRGAALLRRLLVGRAQPVTAFQKLPLAVPAECANTQEPASVSYALRRQLQELEADGQILAAGLSTVQPWLDIPELGSAVVVVADQDAGTARSACVQLAATLWHQRRAYLPQMLPAEEAVRQAHQVSEGLVVLSDGADATTAGAPGDSTHILRELLKYDWPRPALITLVAPGLVEEARQRGRGAKWTASLGGLRDRRYSQPLTLRVQVANLFEARFVMSGHLGKNLPINMGSSAVLQHKNVHVIATSQTGPHFAPELFQAAGLDPFAARVLVAKSPCGFRAAYEQRAKKILLVQALGCAPSDFWHYDYQNIPRPLWPWDEIPSWSPDPVCISQRRS
ncbi:MAG TPA: M81 family metallopeptidase [Gemmataceae bacterium]|nr:M81 family metallopeptidase [Gemmataceae bacterium]